jgi:exodeoxyribonuclease VII small subunit
MATTGVNPPNEPGADAPPDVTTLSYASAGAELDAIINEFETGVIDVDRLVDQLERATDIVDELDRRLRRTRMRVEELVPRLEAIGKDEPTGADRQDDGSDRSADAGSPEGPNGGEASPGLF